MKKLFPILALLFLPILVGSTPNINEEKEEVVTDEYNITMRIHVPRVYDNYQSIGYRKYQGQVIKGKLKISYRENGKFYLRVTDLVNKTHKINKQSITYTTTVDNEGYIAFPRLCYVGSNKTGIFKTPNMFFYMDAVPSYNIGEDEPDNSLLIYLSGVGTTKTFKDSCGNQGRLIKTMKGSITGTLGCGCMAYGHKSPTRTANEYGATDKVTDVAVVWGTWNMKFDKRYLETIKIEEE